MLLMKVVVALISSHATGTRRGQYDFVLASSRFGSMGRLVYSMVLIGGQTGITEYITLAGYRITPWWNKTFGGVMQVFFFQKHDPAGIEYRPFATWCCLRLSIYHPTT
jgi:hypothetical protein